MPTSDFSRLSTEFRKRYDGVRLQQGRVLTDDDFNEAGRLEREDQRQTRLDVIGATGSPDDGFLIGSPVIVNSRIDFDLAAGSLYLGGLRLNLTSPTTYLAQSDFLQIPVVPAPVAPRIDLVYIEAFQQHVSATEDDELFEKALAGPDTSTRLKTMQRIHVAPGAATDDCVAAFWQVMAGMAGQGTLNADRELVSDARLNVDFVPAINTSNLCNPVAQPGYLDAENQALRVEIVDGSHFTWGRDNTSPLYRVEVTTNADGERRVIHMPSEPKDQFHWPMSGQTVELLPWSAILPNGEKVAGTSGLLAKVNVSYSPVSGNFEIDTTVDGSFGLGWQEHALAGQLAGSDQFFYLRVWNRGGDLSQDAAIEFVPNSAVPVPLGDTGLGVRFQGTQLRPGDHWVIAARPEAPDQIVPWRLLNGREAHGYRRFFAPLGLIAWIPSGDTFTGTVIDDCRETFLPLTRLKGCCTHTVGDGLNSYGRFQSIQAAIDALPPQGGEVCVLPGTHVGPVLISGKQNVKLHGCGPRSRVVPAGGSFDTLVRVEQSSGVEISSLALEAPFLVIDAEDVAGLSILSNRIVNTGGPLGAAAPPTASMAAVRVRADDVLIEANWIGNGPSVRRLSSAMGGIHLRGGCERCEIRRNEIRDGNGNGITLGSFFRPNRGEEGEDSPGIFFFGFTLTFDEDGCPEINVNPTDPGDGNIRPVPPVSEGVLYGVRILDNHILRMGMSGIASAFTIGTSYTFRPAATGSIVLGLDILANRIDSCMQLAIANFATLFEDQVAFGGISLQSATPVLIRDNQIAGCGANHGGATAGIFIRKGAAVVVEQNLITGNGSSLGVVANPNGTRGGLVIIRAAEPTKGDGITRMAVAARIHNNVVATPVGPALRLGAAGAVSVNDNRFESNGVIRRNDDLNFTSFQGSANSTVPREVEVPGKYTGHTGYLGAASRASAMLEMLASSIVLIANRGASTELESLKGLKDSLADSQPLPGAAGNNAVLTGASTGSGGQILFEGNQVLATVTEGLFPPRFCVVLGTRDDVGMSGNQVDCAFDRFFFANTLLFGLSVRMINNRFQESLASTFFSAMTMGLANFSVMNQATHCILAMPAPQVTAVPNHVMIPAQVCAALEKMIFEFLTQALLEDKTGGN
jgi:hypothetical protein